MADSQATLLEEFRQIQGAVADSAEAWSNAGGRGGGSQSNTAPAGNVDSLGDRTGRTETASSSSKSGDSSGGLLHDLGAALLGGLGIVPLGLEIASLFGGGDSTPPPLTRYAMPDSIKFTGSTDQAGALTNTDFGQMGQARTYATPSSQYSTTTTPAPNAPASSGSQSQPIQITVQAMDAQSFLDRSHDIASAVNKAILSLHPIADTIQNL